MAKKKLPVGPSILVEWTKNGPVVDITGFENLSPVKIEKCFLEANKEWYRLRSAHIHERRKREMQKPKELVGVADG